MAFVLLCLFSHSSLRLSDQETFGEISSRQSLGMQRRIGDMTSVLSENLPASREIRAFNLEDKEEQRFRESSGQFLASDGATKYTNMLTPIIEIITASGIAVAIFQASQMSVRLDAVVPVIMVLSFPTNLSRNWELF